jgi:hypothetical protein
MKMWMNSEVCYLCRKSIENVVQIPGTPSVWVRPKSTTGLDKKDVP